VSLDLFVHTFHDGELVDLDEALVHAVLEPHVVGREPRYRLVHVAVGEATAEVYGYAGPWHGLTVNRPQGAGVWDLLVELLDRTGAVLSTGWDTHVVADAGRIAHLPAEFTGPVTVVRTGAELEAAL
jgi:hypothetical protein